MKVEVREYWGKRLIEVTEGSNKVAVLEGSNTEGIYFGICTYHVKTQKAGKEMMKALIDYIAQHTSTSRIVNHISNTSEAATFYSLGFRIKDIKNKAKTLSAIDRNIGTLLELELLEYSNFR